MASKRMKRDEPGRTEPNRTVPGHPGHAEHPASPPRKHPNKVIEDAVGAAYRIADGHIQQGRRAAARVREGSYSSANLEEDLRALLDRTLILYKELGAATIDLFDGVLRTGLSPRSAAQSAPGSGAGQGASGPGPQEMTIQVKSARPAQVTVALSPTSSSFVPRVLPLHTANAADPALEGVRFSFERGSRPTLIVEISNDQRAGAYTGSIVDEITHEPGGSVSVRILES
jgi:hypothetical protein